MQPSGAGIFGICFGDVDDGDIPHGVIADDGLLKQFLADYNGVVRLDSMFAATKWCAPYKMNSASLARDCTTNDHFWLGGKTLRNCHTIGPMNAAFHHLRTALTLRYRGMMDYTPELDKSQD